MMKLRNLFQNLDLAEMLVKNWNYDQTSLDLFQHFRISANAIYPFRRQGQVCYLRCCPAEEKTAESIQAELAFVDYLRRAGYPALEPVQSKTGEMLVQKVTPWGEYSASVFKRVKGQSIEESDYADEIMFAYGAALGQLHVLSKAYEKPHVKRWTHLDVFDWVEATLTEMGNQSLALEEVHLLREAFATLPVTPDYYGLIHYDFELDNVYYDAETGICSVIDFDDAVYHWYLLDVLNALVSLKKEIAAEAYPVKKAVFLDGYRNKFDLDDDQWTTASLLLRFDNLYSYTRNARAVQEAWEHEPEWMVGLRAKLARAQAQESANFGKPVSLSLYNSVW